jgi:hypothetical protein
MKSIIEETATEITRLIEQLDDVIDEVWPDNVPINLAAMSMLRAAEHLNAVMETLEAVASVENELLNALDTDSKV